MQNLERQNWKEFTDHFIIEGKRDFSAQSAPMVVTVTPEKMGRWNQAVELLSNGITSYYISPNVNQRKHEDLAAVMKKLIKNAVFYSIHEQSEIEIKTYLSHNRVNVRVTNEVSKKEWNILREFFGKILSPDSGSQYIKRIREDDAARENPGLGLLFLKKRYNANVSFSVLEDGNERMWLSINADIKAG